MQLVHILASFGAIGPQSIDAELFSGAANAISGPSKSYWSLLKTYLGMKSYSPITLMQQNRAVCGYHLGHLANQPELIASAMNELLSLYGQGKIKPQIDSVWAYSDVSVASVLLSTSY